MASNNPRLGIDVVCEADCGAIGSGGTLVPSYPLP